MSTRRKDKDPGFYYFPGDWKKDAGVQSLDYTGKGIWWETLNIMLEGKPRGTLCLKGRPMTTEEVAENLHLTVKETEHWLAKFHDRGIVSRNTPGSEEEYLPFLPDDCYYNRRMVRDAQVHVKAKINGAKGGNPALLGSKAPPGGGQKPVERPAPERPAGKVPARAGEEEPEEFWRRVLGPEYKDLAHFPGLRRHASQYEAVQSILKRTKTRSKEWPELGAFINKKLGKYDATRISGTLNRLFDLADTGEVKGDYWGMAEALLQKPDVHERELKRLAGVQRSGMTSISSIIGQGGEGGADGKD